MGHGRMPPPVQKAWDTDRGVHHKMSVEGGRVAGRKRRIAKEDKQEATQILNDKRERERTEEALAASIARNEHIITPDGEPGPFPDGKVPE